MRAPAARLHRRAQVDAASPQRRRKTEQQAGQNRDREREREHGSVERDRLEPWNVSRIDRPHDLEGGLRDQQTGGATEQPQEQALRQELADEPLPARAKRRAYGDFLLTAGRPREQQVGDVHAGNEQHERHESQQHQHGQPNISDDGLDQRHRIDRERGVTPVLLADPGGGLQHVAPCLLQRHAGLQARHHVEVLVAAALGLCLRPERQRQEHIHLTNAGDRGHDLAVHQEVPLEDADDLELIAGFARARTKAVERDRLADDRRIAAERALPERVAENHDGRLARHVLVSPQETPVHRPGAEQRKQTGRGLERLDALRLVRANQRADAPARDRHQLERSILLLNVEVLPRRRPILRNVDPGRPQPQHREPIRFRIRQRLQQQRIDDAEDRAVGADADRQRRDDHKRQRPAATQRAAGVTEVLEEVAHAETIPWPGRRVNE